MILGMLISIHYLAKSWCAGLSNLGVNKKVYHHFNVVPYLINSIFLYFFALQTSVIT